MQKKIVIIGAGMSGLTAGIYGLLNGYQVSIIEKHSIVGGLCTGWYRKGYYLDGCIHWLTGSKEGDSLNDIWKTIHAFTSKDDFINLPTWGQFDHYGTKVTFGCDLAKTEEEWLKISPEDKRPIKLFFKMVRKIYSFELPLDAPASMLPFKVKMRFLKDVIRTYPYFFKGMSMSCEDFAKRFKSPALRFALTHVQPGKGNLYSMMFCYGMIANGSGGIPKGGSLEFINKIKNYYLSLGGEIIFNKEITSIDVTNGKVNSISSSDGSKYQGDYYITCLDSNYVLLNLLGNKYHHKELQYRYERPYEHPGPSSVLIYYLVPTHIKMNTPMCFKTARYMVGYKSLDYITMRNYSYDDIYIKNNKTILQVLIDQDSNDYIYWENLYKNNAKYLQTKQDIALFIQERIEKYIPDLKGKMECLDISTPITLNRYTNASRGTYMSYLFNSERSNLRSHGRLKGISNLYLAGQYMQSPGGLPLAAASGKFAIQRIKKYDK